MRRRQELGLSIRAAAKAAVVDRATWTALEEGTRTTQDRHYAGIEQALQWPTGTIQAIVSGEHPWLEQLASTSTPDLLDDTERQIWSMDLLDEDLRWDYIRIYRKKKQQKRNSATGESA